MVFSKFFIVFQNVITITMIAASITMVCQIVHMINAPVGYKTKNLLVMQWVNESQLSAFIGELKGLSCVDRVGKTQGLPYSVVIIGLLLIEAKYIFPAIRYGSGVRYVGIGDFA